MKRGINGDKTPLRFVVQKHQASHLHYDFRLELDGVLKSWAIPKGPSMNPHDKRLAVQVEDHPLDYRTFEGIIPEGSYGAGTVKIWDEGTYYASETAGHDTNEEILRQELNRGVVSFVLNGKKLHGKFSLIRFKDDPKKWFLTKSHNERSGEGGFYAD